MKPKYFGGFLPLVLNVIFKNLLHQYLSTKTPDSDSVLLKYKTKTSVPSHTFYTWLVLSVMIANATGPKGRADSADVSVLDQLLQSSNWFFTLLCQFTSFSVLETEET